MTVGNFFFWGGGCGRVTQTQMWGFSIVYVGILKSEGLLEKILSGYFKYHRNHYNVTDIAQSQIKVSLYVTLLCYGCTLLS